MADTMLELQDRIRALEAELAELRKREEVRCELVCTAPACLGRLRVLASPRPEPEHRDDGKSG